MIIFLTTAVVLLGLGIALTLMGLSGRKKPVDIDGDGDADTTARHMRPIPLVLGLILLIAGGVGTFMIFSEGLESPKYDNYVRGWTPAGSLVAQLDDDRQTDRMDAQRELDKRYKAGQLSTDVRAQLSRRWAANKIGDDENPDMPKYADSLVEIDAPAERKAGNISDESWTLVLAGWVPKRLSVPDSVNLGEGLPLNYMVGLGDAPQKIWALARFEELSFAGKDIPLPDSVIVVPNPNLVVPEFGEGQGEATPVDPSTVFGGGPPAPRPEMSRFTDLISAEAITAAGAGEHPLTGRFVVYIFDAETAPIPTELLPPVDEAAGDMPKTVTARLTKEQADALISKALGSEQLPMRERMIQVVDPATSQDESESDASTQPADLPPITG